MKSFTFWIVILHVCCTGNVQGQHVYDKSYVGHINQTRTPITYTHLRESDVTWARRVWRKLDLREKVNHKFYYPIEPIDNRQSLVQVLINAVDEGTLTAFDPLDDEFSRTLTAIEVDEKLRSVDTLWVPSGEPPYEPEMVIIPYEFDVARVKQIRLLEEWFFDKQLGVMGVRIIGIQPVAENIDPATGEARGTEPMFWVYFPEARNIFSSVAVFNEHNDAERKTLDDVFWKRMFGSYIYKIDNVYNRQVADYTQGMDQLFEAEKLKEDIFCMETDLWEY